MLFAAEKVYVDRSQPNYILDYFLYFWRSAWLFIVVTTAEKELVVMFSCRLKKWNKYSIKQDRNFVVTNMNIYNFKQKRKFAMKWNELYRWADLLRGWRLIDFLILSRAQKSRSDQKFVRTDKATQVRKPWVRHSRQKGAWL